jgi:type I restriction enzyme S subunit
LKEKKVAVINNAVTKGLDKNAELVDSGVEWIGKIPKGWEVSTLKKLFKKRVSGYWGSDPVEGSINFPCLRVADFNFEKISYHEVLTMRHIPKIPLIKFLNNEDILIEKSGGGELQPVGRVIYFHSDKKMICANFIDILRPKPGLHCSKFITYFMYSLYKTKNNIKYIKQNTGIQNLDISNYLTENIYLPTLEAQQKIAKYLDEKTAHIDKIVEKQKQSMFLLKEFKQSLISNVATGKIKV